MHTKIKKQKFKAIGAFLKRARTRAKLSQGHVAKALGYTTSQLVSDWERGICGPPLKSLRTLADMYELTDSALIKCWLAAERRELEASVRGLK